MEKKKGKMAKGRTKSAHDAAVGMSQLAAGHAAKGNPMRAKAAGAAAKTYGKMARRRSREARGK